MKLLTDDEVKIIDMTVELMTAFKNLEEHHPCDIEEMVFFVHRIQEKVMARAAIRGMPDLGWTPMVTRKPEPEE